MRNIFAFTLVFIILSMLSSSGFCQITASEGASVSARIVESRGLAKSINTDVGHLAIILSAFVKMAPVGIPATKGGIILPVSSGTFTAAIYDFSGSEGQTYSISYPVEPFMIRTGSDALQVASFTSDPARNAASDMIAGVFVSVTPANVTVNYN